MIPYEELDRALARWKARAQGVSLGAVAEAEPSLPPPLSAAPEEILDAPTPLPFPSEELGAVPHLVSPASERTGEVDANDIDSYEPDDR